MNHKSMIEDLDEEGHRKITTALIYKIKMEALTKK